MKVTLIAYTMMAATEDSDDQFEGTGYKPHPFHFEFERTLNPSLPQPVRAADELAEFAGRACYQSWDRPNEKTATNEGYLANIIEKQHFSVLEHASFTVYVTGISRTCGYELLRHRFISRSELSQRYVDVSELEFVVPPVVDQNGGGASSAWLMQAKLDYQSIVEDQISEGASRKDARGAARNYLPQGWETRIVLTANFRAWREFLQKRLSPAAEPEIRLFAAEILKIAHELSPNAVQDIVKEYAQ